MPLVSAGRVPAPRYRPLGCAFLSGLAGDPQPEMTPRHSIGIAWLSLWDGLASSDCRRHRRPGLARPKSELAHSCHGIIRWIMSPMVISRCPARGTLILG